MNSMEDQYGFDACFISDVPDYLKCGMSSCPQATHTNNEVWTPFL